MAVAGQREHHVDRGQPGSDDHDRVVAPDAIGRRHRPRVVDHRVDVARQRSGRGIPERKHDVRGEQGSSAAKIDANTGLATVRTPDAEFPSPRR